LVDSPVEEVVDTPEEEVDNPAAVVMVGNPEEVVEDSPAAADHPEDLPEVECSRAAVAVEEVDNPLVAVVVAE